MKDERRTKGNHGPLADQLQKGRKEKGADPARRTDESTKEKEKPSPIHKSRGQRRERKKMGDAMVSCALASRKEGGGGKGRREER